jgi:hypothetical protein
MPSIIILSCIFTAIIYQCINGMIIGECREPYEWKTWLNAHRPTASGLFFQNYIDID